MTTPSESRPPGNLHWTPQAQQIGERLAAARGVTFESIGAAVAFTHARQRQRLEQVYEPGTEPRLVLTPIGGALVVVDEQIDAERVIFVVTAAQATVYFGFIELTALMESLLGLATKIADTLVRRKPPVLVAPPRDPRLN